MRTVKILITSLLIVLLAFPAFSQQPEKYTDEILNRDQMKEDFGILYNTIINYHPNPFQYTTSDEFESYFNKQMADFPDSLTSREFLLIARKLNLLLKCGHSFGIPSAEWYKSLKGKKVLLPFEITRAGDKILVKNITEDETEVAVNDELISINNIPVETLLRKMSEIQERDGFTQAYLDDVITRRFRTYYFFMFGVPDSILVEYNNSGNELRKVVVNLSNQKLKPEPDKYWPAQLKIFEENKWSKFAMDTVSGIAYLKISSFSDRKEYKKYYKTVFSEIEKQGCRNLIIDLRDNGGGYFHHGNRFLTYLSPEKFDFNFLRPRQKPDKNEHTSLGTVSKLTRFAFSLKPQKYKAVGKRTNTFSYKPKPLRFKNKVSVITNGITFSTAALVSAQLKQNGATFYGTETGGAENGTNAMLINKLVLPNSGLQFNIPWYQVVSNSTNENIGYGVKPDVEIRPGADIARDNVMMEVMERIRRENQSMLNGI